MFLHAILTNLLNSNKLIVLFLNLVFNSHLKKQMTDNS